MPSHSHHVELTLYVEDTAVIATSRQPMLLFSCLESYLKGLQRWLSEWRIASNVCKSTAIIFVRVGRPFIQLRPVTLFGQPIQWVDATLYLGVTRLNWSPHIDQVRSKTAQRMGMLGPHLKGRVISPSGTDFCYIRSSSAPLWIMRAPHGGPQPALMSGCYRCYNPSVFALLLVPPGTYVTGR